MCVRPAVHSSVVTSVFFSSGDLCLLLQWPVNWLPRPVASFAALPPREASSVVPLKDAFLSFLRDSNHQVRMKVAHLIPVLFQPVRTGCVTNQLQLLSRSAQEMLFTTMKQVLSASPDVLLVSEEEGALV